MSNGYYDINENIMNEMISKYENGSSILKLKEEFGFSHGKITREFKKRDIKIRDNSFNSRKYSLENENYFETIDTEEKAYWLGFILADGYIQKQNKHSTSDSLGIAIIDQEHLLKFKDNIKTSYPVNKYTTTEKNSYKVIDYYRIIIKNKKLTSDLIKHGIKYQKTGKITYPEIIKNNVFERDFIRGYFDGNGSITKTLAKRKTISDCYNYDATINSTLEFLEYIKTNITSYNDSEFTQRHPDRDNNNYDYDFTKLVNIKQFLNYLYKDANIYLDRKYKRYLEFIEKRKRIEGEKYV